MKINNISIKNFRSINELSLDFPEHYTAISGKNNSGKSNVLKPLKILFEPEKRFRFYDGDIKYSQDFPLWGKSDPAESIKFEISLNLSRESDSSVFKLVEDFFKLNKEVSNIDLKLSIEYQKNKELPEYQVGLNDVLLDSYKSKAIFRTIKTSGAFQFYNSTEPINPLDARSHLAGLVGELSKSDRDEVFKDRDKLTKTVSKLAKKHQKDVSELLGRLEEKYSIGLSAPKLSLDYLPINITLGDKSVNVSLDDWGSGTKNRTNILLALFKAKKLSESLDEDTKISPILVIEEPESFLHPSAQAEFGRVIQALSEEFGVQVIVATHSPYFLSQHKPESNVLLNRVFSSGILKPTEKITVDAKNWMEPFALNLGLANPEFEPWQSIFFSKSEKILLVEGEIDKAYFELLRDDAHGSNRLNFDGEIFQYGGSSTIQNQVLLRFIQGKYDRFFITFDLDCEKQVTPNLTGLGMVKGKQFIPVGKDDVGKNCIEGLLPESIISAVYGKNASLVQQALSNGSSDKAKSAKNKLKKLLLDEFLLKARPGNEYYSDFYKIVTVINKAMR
ncbi:ATP-binding protein [Ferrovum sp. PN-J185]|uniref:ATP-dependent nuclease n=1 Tax=Ferrovum sp. PN-J185 TaxID=1356306 RepID=UPI001E3115EB|nr:AAA family ATPase [Ferrovum sp. PN-J185]MCC6067685.1 ATP-binding protein [Ferrovum sp. PN-J185]